MSLKEIRDTMLQVAHPDRLLKYADSLMEGRRTQGDMFKLNAQDAWLKPLLEFYTEDLEGWVAFIKNVRDRLEYRSPEYIEVNAYFKVVHVRWVQRRTRAITSVAIDLAIKKGLIDNTWDAKIRYEKRCIQSWKARKDNMLLNVRKASKTGRVSQSQREELLLEFWSNVSDEVNNGEIPAP